MSDFASILSDTQDRIETAQLVLSNVEQGLQAVEKAEAIAKRTRPILRSVSIAILGCLVGLGIFLVIRSRRKTDEVEIPEGESSEGEPVPDVDRRA